MYIAVLCEAADQGHPEWAIIRLRSRGGKQSDAMDLGRRLRFSTPKRSEQRAAQDFDELPPFHSITSSARIMMDRGIVMPSALAVLRLTMSSTSVVC